MNNTQQKELITLISKKEYDRLEKLIPAKFRLEIIANYAEYLLKKSEQQILDFYNELINDNNQWTIPKIVGSIIILTAHIHDLLIKLVETKEINSNIIGKVNKFDLHYLILFCTVKYNIPDDYFIQMMELKHFRNMVAHEFNSIMETNFHQAIQPILNGHLLIIMLTDMIKSSMNTKN